jgi:PhnB protein
MTMTKTAIPYPPLTPALAVNNAARAIDFYRAAFGAVELYRLIDPESGKVGHAELTINGSLIMLSDEYASINKAPASLGGTTVKLSLLVQSVDRFVERARVAGATVVSPAADQFYGFRSASLRDPFGHEWMIQQEIEKVTPEEMQRRWDEMVKNEI